MHPVDIAHRSNHPTLRSRLVRGARSAVVLLALVAGATPARAVQITVTTTEDETTNDGDCSLREATIAANVNTPRDACPAGSASATDEIVLASDAVYSLTIPGEEAQSFTGQLDLNDNTAATDLRVTVAGDGTATISQDAVPDVGVFSIGPNARVDMEDVVVQNGAANNNSIGGGAFAVSQGAQLFLERCVVQNNSSSRSGGAIRVAPNGTLSVEDCVFSNNVAAESGGAIGVASGTFTVVQRSFFFENVAGATFGGGGAIESTAILSVVDSAFVDNRAFGKGGAITHFHTVANEASVVGSCFVGNASELQRDAVHVFQGSEPLNAPNNWWGADDGPSGAGAGHGDAISTSLNISPIALTPHAACEPFELVANGGFEAPGIPASLPEGWSASGLNLQKEGRACSEPGRCLVKIRGGTAAKELSQTVRLAGEAGDGFVFRARSRAQGVPAAGGRYRVQLTIQYIDGSEQVTNLDFSPGKHGFERKSAEVVASEDYDRMKVRVQYGRPSGVARFDSIGLERAPQ